MILMLYFRDDQKDLGEKHLKNFNNVKMINVKSKHDHRFQFLTIMMLYQFQQYI